MAQLWPWLAVAGVGALHGLNPATGWAFAVALGLRSGDWRQALRALVPIAVGHAASVLVVAALVAGAVAVGLSMDVLPLQLTAGALFLLTVGVHLARRKTVRGRAHRVRHAHRASHAGLALWSFMMATAHGAGLMLVPALVPLCMGGAPAAREITASGSLLLALAAVGVHTAAMLAVTGLVATGVCRGVRAGTAWRRFRRASPRPSSPTSAPSN